MTTTTSISDPHTRRIAEEAEHLERFDSCMRAALLQVLDDEDDARIALGVVASMISRAQQVELGRDLAEWSSGGSRDSHLVRKATQKLAELVRLSYASGGDAEFGQHATGTPGADPASVRRIEKTLRQLTN